MFRVSSYPSSGDVENVACYAGNILHTVHTSCHPTLQHHNNYNRTDKYRQWNAVGFPDDGHKDARNMLRYYWLPINHYLLHLVGLTCTYLSKMHGHSNIKYAYFVYCNWKTEKSLRTFLHYYIAFSEEGREDWNTYDKLKNNCICNLRICVSCWLDYLIKIRMHNENIQQKTHCISFLRCEDKKLGIAWRFKSSGLLRRVTW